jgi:hypothetical protein
MAGPARCGSGSSTWLGTMCEPFCARRTCRRAATQQPWQDKKGEDTYPELEGGGLYLPTSETSPNHGRLELDTLPLVFPFAFTIPRIAIQTFECQQSILRCSSLQGDVDRKGHVDCLGLLARTIPEFPAQPFDTTKTSYEGLWSLSPLFPPGG